MRRKLGLEEEERRLEDAVFLKELGDSGVIQLFDDKLIYLESEVVYLCPTPS